MDVQDFRLVGCARPHSQAAFPHPKKLQGKTHQDTPRCHNGAALQSYPGHLEALWDTLDMGRHLVRPEMVVIGSPSGATRESAAD